MRPPFHALTLAALAVFCHSVVAQTAVAQPAAPAGYAAEPIVIRSSNFVVSMNADGTGTRVQTNSIAVHSDASARQLSVLSLTYASQAERADFNFVRVTHADGTVQETPVSSAMDQPAPVTQQAPFYSDIKIKQLPVRSLRAGDTLEWQATFTLEHPEARGQFWDQFTFSKSAIVLSEDVELRLPPGVRAAVWTNPRAKVVPLESDSAGRHVYRWHTSNLTATAGPEAEAHKKAELKRIRTADEELDMRKGELPSIAWSSFADWAAVGDWYRTLSTGREAPDAAIKAKVAELTAGKSGDVEKAQAIYIYVSTQIRYIGVAFGIGRYQPHSAAEVFANQYGDCKDKHTLLAAMLSLLNLRAEPVLVGAGIRFNSAVPSPSAFNHLITRVLLNGNDVWLDATAEAGAWGALLNVVRDQEALVVTGKPPAVITRTPADLPYPQTVALAVTSSLDDSLTSESKFVLTLHDDTELYFRAALHTISPSDYDAFVQRLMGSLGFGGTTSEPVIDHLDDPTQPLQISFHYRRVKEKDWGEKRVTIPFLTVSLPYYRTEDPPTSAIQLGAPRTEITRVELQFPKGWSASRLEDVHAHAPFANCDITYRIEKDKLIAERRFTILKREVPVSEAKKYLTWYDEADAGSVPFLEMLPRPKEVTAAAAADAPKAPKVGSPAAVQESDPQAAALVQKAFVSVRNMDLDSARKNLDDANKINPTQRGLWTGYAAVAQMLGKRTECITDLQQELAYHPDEPQVYAQLARQQRASGNTAAVLATLQAWDKAAPSTPEAAVALAQQLASMKRHDEALGAAQSAITRLQSTNADLTDLHIAAANAQIALGHKKEAAAQVAPLLGTATDPMKINDIAYVLAEAGSDLPEAESAQAEVIAKRSEDSTAWTLSDTLRPRFIAETGMAAQWDTMGWILFREGKFAEAEGYLSASIRAFDHEDTRKHMAALNAALHRPATATQTDQKLRTYPLGPAKGRHGVAGFNLLIVDGKVTDSKSTHDQAGAAPSLDHAEDLLQTADLHALFPPGSKAHLLRMGYVNCHVTTCELILQPAAITARWLSAPMDFMMERLWPFPSKPASCVLKNLS